MLGAVIVFVFLAIFVLAVVVVSADSQALLVLFVAVASFVSLVFLVSSVVLALLVVSAVSVLLVWSAVLPSHPPSPKHAFLAQHDDHQEHQGTDTGQHYSDDVFGAVILLLVLQSSWLSLYF